MSEEVGGTEATRSALARLAEALLQYYNVTGPPVPIERMLQKPPAGLAGVDPSQISTIIEHGLYRYEPRLAMARLLYREIARIVTDGKALDVDIPSSVSYADVKFFARCLLMPSLWMRGLVKLGLSVEQMSVRLQVPAYALVTRMAELGLPIPDTG